jgi:hypothetical protein
MSTTLPLFDTSTVVLDGSGNGSCQGVGPLSPGETWTVSLISVQCSSNVNEAICSVYCNGILLGTTTWGSTGDSDTGITQFLANGQVITATWTGGDAGAVATMGVTGTKVV